MRGVARIAECHPTRKHRGRGLCGNCYEHDYYERNADRIRLRARLWGRKDRTGVSLEQYNTMLRDQGGVCAICGLAETAKHQSGRTRDLAIDHDHATGRVRGLLCHACNTSLGAMRDDPVRLMAAAAYVTANIA